MTKAIIDTNQTFENMNVMETASVIKQYFHDKRGDRGDSSTVAAVTGGSTASDLTKMQIRKELIMMRPPDVEKINSVIEQHKLMKQQQKQQQKAMNTATRRMSMSLGLGSLSLTSSAAEHNDTAMIADNNSIAQSSLSHTLTGVGTESLRMPSITKDQTPDRENRSLLTAVDDDEESQATLSSSFLSNLTSITHRATDLGRLIAAKASAVLSDDTSRGTSEVDIRRLSAWQLFKKRKAILNDIKNAKIQLVRYLN